MIWLGSICSLWLGCAEPASGATASSTNELSDAVVRERVVLGIVDIDALDGQPVDVTLDGALVDLGVDVDVQSLPDASAWQAYEWARHQALVGGTRAVYWLAPARDTDDLHVGRLHLLWPADPSRIYVRDLMLDTESEAVLLESLAAIMRASTQSLAEGRPSGLRAVDAPTADTVGTDDDAPEHPTVIVAAASPQPRPRVTVGVGYRGGTLDVDRLPWQHGGALDFDVVGPSGAGWLGGGALSGQAWPTAIDDLDLAISRLAVVVRVGRRLTPHPRLFIDATTGTTVERFAWRIGGVSADSVDGDVDGAKVRLAIDLEAALRVRLVAGLGAFVRAGAHVWAINVKVLAHDAAEPRTVLYPALASGDTTVGVSYTF